MSTLETDAEPIAIRPAKKARHREKLIQAAADIVAEEGIAATSVTRIIERAGLSRGMIHLHFDGKNSLLVEVVKQMNKKYYREMGGFIEQAGSTPQEKVQAIVEADLGEVLLTPQSVSLWAAFRGEARSKNEFMQYTDTRDDELRNMIFEAYLSLSSRTENAETIARDAMHGTIALLEGMWTDYFLHTNEFNRDTAKRIIFRFIAGVYPDAFDIEGAKVT